MGLKILSEQFRNDVLKLNLKTPPDIVLGLTELSGRHIYRSYIDSLGKDTFINTYTVKNPGDILVDAVEPRKKDLLRNRPLDVNDPSENDPMYNYLSNGSYNYSALLSAIGKPTIINDLAIPNAISISKYSNQTPEVTLNLALQHNRYIPVDLKLNTFESRILNLTPNQFTQPYVDAFKSGVYTLNESENYEPSQFLNLNVNGSSSSFFNIYSDPISYLTTNNKPPLPNETLIMNIAALELKFNFESRLKRAVERETLGRTYLDEATRNPLTAVGLLTGRQPLFEANYSISVADNPVSRSVEFLSSLTGVISPFTLINNNPSVDYTPKCFGNTTNYDTKEKGVFGRFIDDLSGRTSMRDRDIYFLNHTGPGQKYALFSTLKKNKYSPDYTADYQSGVFGAADKVAEMFKGITGFLGVGSGKTPLGRYYIGNKSKDEDPFYLLQDADGDQVNSNEELTKSISTKIVTDITKGSGFDYEEPGYDQVSKYGSVETDFIWKSEFSHDTVLNVSKKLSEIVKGETSVKDQNKLSYVKYARGGDNTSFRECSILYKTSQLLEKGIHGFGSPIDQTLTKFYDGYNFVSRGNSTIAPTKVNRFNKQGEVIGNSYIVPGLDVAGNRSPSKMYNEAELCRTWTKLKPYAKIKDLTKFKELNRRERNSVLDRYGNINIYPSELNVNTINGEKRARKFMFSLENLAWRDSEKFTDLPSCEKGPNNGRIMWFPPYDLKFSEDTQGNWTTHQFLGRPEPIYTYNTTERSGTLSWKIIVDHPSILNLLTQKELAKLNDGEIDEILAAFWSGCVDFDVFELARIWNQFSQSDIDYFKTIIGSLNMKTPNETLRSKVDFATVYKQPSKVKQDNTNSAVPKFLANGNCLFFENNVPLPTDRFTKGTTVYDTGVVEGFDVYFKQYKELASGVKLPTDSSESITLTLNPEWFDYKNSIGIGSNDSYFFNNEPDKKSEKYYGFERQYNEVEQELRSSKFDDFDLTITLKAHSSPLGLSATNTDLSQRRNTSVLKWLLLKVLSGNRKLYSDVDAITEIDINNIDEVVKQIGSSGSVYRKDSIGNITKITFNLIALAPVTTKDLFGGKSSESIQQQYYNVETSDSKSYNYFLQQTTPATGTTSMISYCCFDNSDTTDKIKSDAKAIADLGVGTSQIGSITPKSITKYEDIVCSVLSIDASFCRRVEISVLAAQRPIKPAQKVKEDEQPPVLDQNEMSVSSSNVTKREIAQRILNKLITECDYFELLKSDSPVVYESLKQKLKFFSPGFHSMTPEGLNARLTFLQQCLRPGETIKRANGDTCDASNTAFGKPPVCVLRIGDFYNTKIVINNLSVSYEPLIFDLNPEGIGVQPMLADISLSFKYIGGSGLRKHVDELQNALSFNFYANTDVYDDRTFANTDPAERNLVNSERSFFDENTLDLIPIVSAAEKIFPEDYNSKLLSGTIGTMTKKRQPTTGGGSYYGQILNAATYSGTEIYQPFTVVTSNQLFYLRKADDETNTTTPNTLNGTLAPVSNNKYWNEIAWRNYGEEAFILEFNQGANTNNTDKFTNKTYFNWYEVQYQDIFKELYSTYGQIVSDNFDYNTLLSKNSTLLQLLFNKNYNKVMGTTGKSSDVFQSLSTFKVQDGTIDIPAGTNGVADKFYLFDQFDREADERNYLEFSELKKLTNSYDQDLSNTPLTPIKLHLYPQNQFYKIGDGKQLSNGTDGIFDYTTRFNPGNLTGDGFGINKAEVGGIYLKNFNDYETNLISLSYMMLEEMKAKLKLDIAHFWHFNGKAKDVFKDYKKYFELPYKNIFVNHMLKKLYEYNTSLLDYLTTPLKSAKENTAKLGVILSGLSVITEGYEFRSVGPEKEPEKYEVIPNETKLKTSVIELFGYDPYYEYQTLSFNGFEKITFKDVRDYVNNKNSDKIAFLSLGNGAYFFKQISKDTLFTEIVNTNKYTSDNYLVESSVIKNNTDVPYQTSTPNFEFGSDSVLLNSKFDKNAQPGTTKLSDVSIVPGSYSEFYGMTHVFEKINYELFDFSNKTLDIMMNDNFIGNEFNLEVTINPTYDFKSQLGNALIDSVTKNVLKTPINYYTFDTTYLATGSTKTAIDTINGFILHQITDIEYVLTGINGGLPITVDVSGLIDVLYTDFFFTLTNADKAIILSEIKKADPPMIGIKNGTKPKDVQSLINARYKNIENTLNNIFQTIYEYRTACATMIEPIYNSYTANVENINKVTTQIISGVEETSTLTPKLFVDLLLKGDVEDYTLVVKDTINTKETVKNNHSFFTKYKDLFTFVNKSEIPESNEESTANNLDKYTK
jgi:outer membrane protein OmpA-like peptidoglycan-associated protein